MPRIRLIIQYDGTGYVGWQTQPNGVAVQEVIERDIRVIYSDRAEGFHARFDVIRKHYRYTVNNAPHAGVFNRNTALHYHYALDMDKMKRAAGDLLGEHDFRPSSRRALSSKTQSAPYTGRSGAGRAIYLPSI